MEDGWFALSVAMRKDLAVISRRSTVALLVVPSLLLLAGILRTLAVEPGNEHFGRTWSRTDQPVADGVESRTWMWGPEAFTTLGIESYAESPGGQRDVQYFDKARMEITNPNGDTNSIWYVTNGLLVVELMTGRMQVGDDSFEQRSPALVNVAGDANDANGPTYAGMAALRAAPPLAIGTTITQRVDRAGNVTFDTDLGAQGVTVGHFDEVTNHSIAAPFWDFMNSSGTVYVDGQYVTDLLFANPYFATGRPITEPYWALVRVGGAEREVLIQCFERRCLTYTPDNPPGWQVEAGNVGQHYYTWRYEGGGSPTATPTVTSTATTTTTAPETASPTSTGSVAPTASASPTATATGTATATVEPAGPFDPIQTCGGPIVPNQPYGVALGPDGSIHIADTSNHQIVKLSAAGQHLGTWGERGVEDGQLLSPRGIAVDSSGNVYIADYFNDRVQVFDSNGTYLRQWGADGSGDGEFDRPADIAITSNLVFVTDYGNHRVQVFTTQGQYLREWGTNGNGDGQFVGPVGIAGTASGTIYVVDEGNYRVQFFDTQGGYQGQWGGLGGNDGQFYLPTGIAIDPDFGYVYVTDSAKGEVQVFNALGGYLLKFGEGATGLLAPTAVATTGTSAIWVADRDAMNIELWASDGPGIAYQTTWSEIPIGKFSDPEDVTVDQNGFIYVIDRTFNRITRFTSECTFDRFWGSRGSGNSEYFAPVAAAISPDNLVYTVDQGNDRVQVTSNIGAFVREWGQYGNGQGEFNIPTDLAFNAAGNVYVVDSGNNRVQVFSNVGVYQFEWGTAGSGPGQFSSARDIEIANNQVYVTDTGNQRVQIFDLSGNYQGELTAPTDVTWFSINDVAANPDGYVFVHNTVWFYVFTPGGVYLDRYEIEDTGGNFIGGESMDFAPNGDMYVVDDFSIGLYVFEVSDLQ